MAWMQTTWPKNARPLQNRSDHDPKNDTDIRTGNAFGKHSISRSGYLPKTHFVRDFLPKWNRKTHFVRRGWLKKSKWNSCNTKQFWDASSKNQPSTRTLCEAPRKMKVEELWWWWWVVRKWFVVVVSCDGGELWWGWVVMVVICDAGDLWCWWVVMVVSCGGGGGGGRSKWWWWVVGGGWWVVGGEWWVVSGAWCVVGGGWWVVSGSKNAVKYSISDMLCCESVANSGVFATLVVLGFA